MAKKHSTRKAAGVAPRKKEQQDVFNYWCDPRDAAAAREKFLTYCILLDRAAVFVSRFLAELLRAGCEMPTLQSVALPAILQDSVFLDLDNAEGGLRKDLEALREPTEHLLKVLPETIVAARELDQRIFDFVEKLTGGPGSRDGEMSEFILQRTELGTLESRTRGDFIDQLGLRPREEKAQLASSHK